MGGRLKPVLECETLLLLLLLVDSWESRCCCSPCLPYKTDGFLWCFFPFLEDDDCAGRWGRPSFCTMKGNEECVHIANVLDRFDFSMKEFNVKYTSEPPRWPAVPTVHSLAYTKHFAQHLSIREYKRQERRRGEERKGKERRERQERRRREERKGKERRRVEKRKGEEGKGKVRRRKERRGEVEKRSEKERWGEERKGKERGKRKVPDGGEEWAKDRKETRAAVKSRAEEEWRREERHVAVNTSCASLHLK